MIVTLCGSVRFADEFIEASRELSRRGITSIGLQVMPADRRDDEDWSDKGFDKVMADLVYLDKISHSDAILVLGNGYIGFSTAREIVWANMQGKPSFHLCYMVPLPDDLHSRNWDRVVGLMEREDALYSPYNRAVGVLKRLSQAS